MARIIVETPLGKYISLEVDNKDIKAVYDSIKDNDFKLNFLSINTEQGVICLPESIFQNSVFVFEYDEE
jgi:hypothetical protein